MGLYDRDYMRHRESRRRPRPTPVPLVQHVKFLLWRWWRRIFDS